MQIYTIHNFHKTYSQKIIDIKTLFFIIGHMEKIRIFLDASAISNLEQADMPKEMADMRALWEKIQQGEFEVIVSEPVIEELDRIQDLTKKDKIFKYLDTIDYSSVKITDEMVSIAQMVVLNCILTDKNFTDCLHIGCSIATDCDCLVSYNYKHLKRLSAIRGTQAISIQLGHKILNIVSADSLI